MLHQIKSEKKNPVSKETWAVRASCALSGFSHTAAQSALIWGIVISTSDVWIYYIVVHVFVQFWWCEWKEETAESESIIGVFIRPWLLFAFPNNKTPHRYQRAKLDWMQRKRFKEPLLCQLSFQSLVFSGDLNYLQIIYFFRIIN